MEKINKKTLAIIATIIAIIALIANIVIYIVRNKDKNDIEVTSNNIVNNNVDDNTENITEENTVASETALPEESEKNNENESKKAITTANTEEISIEEINKIKNDEDKAIEIAKKDWGGEENTVFKYDGKDSQGRFIIVVRNKSTLNAICYYHINIETGEFEIKN